MIDESQYFKSLFDSPNIQFLDQLNRFILLDIGIIESINMDGTATVKLNNVIEGNITRVHNVEVLGLGNMRGGITASCTGSTCLVFILRSHITDINTFKFDRSILNYSKENMKVIPITNGKELLVNMAIEDDGDICISTDEYQLTFSPEKIVYTSDGVSIYINGNILQFKQKNKNGGWVCKLDNEGELSLLHTNKDDEILNKVVIDKEGSCTIFLSDEKSITLSLNDSGDIEFTCEGNLSIKADKVNINGSNLEVSAE